MEKNGRKFYYGKYKGSYIKDIIINDTQYITWSMKNVKWFWFNNEEVELYKQQLRSVNKPKNQYEMIMEIMRKEDELGRNKEELT